MEIVVRIQFDTRAASRSLPRLLRNQPVEPETAITDGPRSYLAAPEKLDLNVRNRPATCAISIVSRIHFFESTT